MVDMPLTKQKQNKENNDWINVRLLPFESVNFPISTSSNDPVVNIIHSWNVYKYRDTG